MVIPAVLTGASILGSMLSKGGSETVKQEPMLTEDQKKMSKLLSGVASSGSYNGMNFGEGYGGSMGNYDMTGAETSGQGRLMAMLKSQGMGTSGIHSAGIGTLKDILSTDRYDPYSKTGEFAGFKKNVNKEIGEGTSALKRNAAVGGNLYSKDVVNRIGDLQEEGQDQLGSKLASLYDRYVDRKTGAASTAINAGMGEESANMNRIAGSQLYGSLSRNLENQEATAKYNEWMRARKEKIQPLSFGQSVLGAKANYGAKEMTVPTSSPFQKLFDVGIDTGSGMIGSDYENKTGMFAS